MWNNNKFLRFIASISKFPLSYYDVKDDHGKVIGKDGISLFIYEWIAKRFSHLESELVEPNDPRQIVFNPNTTLPNDADKLYDGAIDLLMGLFVMTPKRHGYVNFPHSFFSDPLIVVLPLPQPFVDIASVWKIFKFEVWIGIFMTSLVMAGAFQVLRHFYESSRSIGRNQMAFHSSAKYMIEVVMNQGGYCNSKSVGVKILACTWCLAAFVIVNSFNSTLVAHLFATSPKPLVKSVSDLFDRTDVKLLVKKASGIDYLLSTTEKGIYKQLGDLLAHERSRCATIHDCLALVRTGSYAYLDSEFTALEGLLSEYKLTKTCEFVFIRESSLGITMAFAAAKNSTAILETVNRGILSMKAHGLIDNWIANHRSITKRECPQADFLHSSSASAKSTIRLGGHRLAPLGLKHLAGAFLVLAVGFSVSLITLLSEKLAQQMHCTRR